MEAAQNIKVNEDGLLEVVERGGTVEGAASEPEAIVGPPPPEHKQKEGWDAYWNPEAKRYYYHHSESGETRWDAE